MLASTADQQLGEYRVFCLCKDKTIEGKDLQLDTYLLCLWRVWRQDFWPTLRFLEESFWSLKESARKFIEIMKFIKCLFCFSPLQCCKLPPRLWLYVKSTIFVSFLIHMFSIQIWEEVFHQDSFSAIGPLSGPHNRALSSKLRLPFLSKICISVWEYEFPSKICLS